LKESLESTPDVATFETQLRKWASADSYYIQVPIAAVRRLRLERGDWIKVGVQKLEEEE